MTSDEMVEELLGPTPPQLPETPQQLFEQRDASLTKIVDPELNRVITEIGHIAYANIADVYHAETTLEPTENNEYKAVTRIALKDLTTLPRSVTAAIQSITVDGHRVQIKMYDKQIAHEKLMKHYGGYAKENEQRATSHDKLLDLLFQGAEAQGLPTPRSNDA